jgi:hypothetical protein
VIVGGDREGQDDPATGLGKVALAGTSTNRKQYQANEDQPPWPAPDRSAATRWPAGEGQDVGPGRVQVPGDLGQFPADRVDESAVLGVDAGGAGLVMNRVQQRAGLARDDLARVVDRPRRPLPGPALREAPGQTGHPHRLPQQDGTSLGDPDPPVRRHREPAGPGLILLSGRAFGPGRTGLWTSPAAPRQRRFSCQRTAEGNPRQKPEASATGHAADGAPSR